MNPGDFPQNSPRRKIRDWFDESEIKNNDEEIKSLLFSWDAHSRFFNLNLTLLPSYVQVQDSNKMMLIFFTLSGLDLLNKVDKIIQNDTLRNNMIDIIYSLQVLPNSEFSVSGGFRGSSSNGIKYSPEGSVRVSKYDYGNLSMTFVCLLCLIILKDDFKRLNKNGIFDLLEKCQDASGSFRPSELDGDCDVRICYCAVAISYLLDGWDHINLESLYHYFISCISYETSFGFKPGIEAHGGSSFCVFASMYLINESKPEVLKSINFDFDSFYFDAEHFLQKRLQLSGGYNGRTNKTTDTCYSFWIGACLWILKSPLNYEFNKRLIFMKNHEYMLYGGFSKEVLSDPDIIHTFFSICGLSMLGDVDGLNELYPPLMITKTSLEHWKSLNIYS